MERWKGVLKRCLLFCGIYLIMFLLLFYSREISDGIRAGIHTSLNLVVPSMFLFMILSNIMIRSQLHGVISLPFRCLTKWIFRIPAKNASIVVLSLVGGYPVGAKLLGDCVHRGEMEPAEAERMLAYCVNCGPAFLISGVGAAIFGNVRLGIYLFLSQIAACLTVGYLNSFYLENDRFRRRRIPSPSTVPSVPQRTSGAELIVGSVSDALRSMALICGFVVTFSSLTPICSLLLQRLHPSLSFVIQGILEVTSGCSGLSACVSLDRPLLAAIFTAFGGICVHLQVCAMLKSTGIRMKRFLSFRPVYTFVSAAITKLLLFLSPETAGCVSLNQGIPQQAVSVSPAATAFLLLLGIMLLFFSGKSVKIKNK